jgi:Pyruvate/2-oxoacid:ferredoxin oxidoreductase delta subunit
LPYKRLAQHLDALPGGFPPTERGVEIKILEHLFSPQEARLALVLTLIPETAATIALRRKAPLVETEHLLETLAAKGLIFRSKPLGKPAVYMAAQFVVGIWELQVGRLTPELARLMGDYMPDLLDKKVWKKTPQMRTIPVGRSIDTHLEILAHEKAETLLRQKSHFAVSACICRKEQQMVGRGCSKPMDMCLSFGDDEDFFIKNRIGRRITLDQALDILKQADRSGLVLQPNNGKEISWLCCCCGCCCGILRTVKTHAKPAEIVSSPFQAVADPDRCSGCGICEKRCPMEAVSIQHNGVVVDYDRCIGCGLCVSTCPEKAIRLERKPDSVQPHVPKNIVTASMQLMWERDKLSLAKLAPMAGRSFMDRYRSRRKTV